MSGRAVECWANTNQSVVDVSILHTASGHVNEPHTTTQTRGYESAGHCVYIHHGLVQLLAALTD